MEGRRRKGRPKRRWMDRVNVDLRENGLSGEETHNRAVWRQLVRNIDRTKKSEKMRWKKICKRTKTCLNSKFKFVPMNKIKTVDSF